MTAPTVIRSRRKTLALEVRAGGEVVVRAPLSCPAAVIARFVQEKQPWIARVQAQRQESRAAFGGAVLDEAALAALKKAAAEDLTARVRRFAPLVGVAAPAVTVRFQRTRWGSCSSKGRLSLNGLLMLTPEDVRDYVVVHELCHLLEMNHSPRFWAQVARVLPYYGAPREWLREHGATLMERMKQS